LGKPRALSVAYRHAVGEWLVFTDADVRMGPDLLRRSLALALEKGWEYLTCLPTPELRSFWEKTFMSYWTLGFDLGQAPWKLSDPHSRRYVGVGAFQLVRRSVYEAVGTHRRLSMEIPDDFKLGKLVKQRGFSCGVAVAGERLRVRWQSGLRGIVNSLMKNSFAGCGFRLRNVALYVVGSFAFDMLPFLALFFSVGIARGVAALCVFIILFLHANGSHAGRVSPLYALTHPLGAAIFCYIMLGSAISALQRQGVVWRDTFYPLNELRRGAV
jgi:glycosyltransferase involved in cell wall biosynthesis